jgi:hypothetical protein
LKVSGTGGPSQPTGAKPARGGGGEGFRIGAGGGAAAAAPAAQVSGVGSVMGVEALIALQQVESPTERRRRSVRRAGRLLDKLDAIKVALLGGDLGPAELEALAHALREERAFTEDPELEAVLDEIETRAAVELAKFESAGRGE